ncbi:ScbR family autoregulator-binding transcription factor [Microbispora sp. NPDC049125]|uniref:ScbR family autoregulator-binding transcription factor n=1 Tax=Microbispora sp. NPDC049125 TaxID=3154929 RepID=UPI0034670497
MRQQRAEITRSAILDAAATVFDEHGYAAASLSDIISQAGVTKGALYFHFPSKEELARELIDAQFQVGALPVAVTDAGMQTLIDVSHDLAANLMDNVRVRAGIRLVIEYGTFESPSPDAYQRWVDVARVCAAGARDKGDLRSGLEPDDVAHYVISSFTGVQLSSQVFSRRADLRRRVTVMWELLLPGIVPPRRLARFSPGGSSAV